jgi:hypothetical protein
VHYVVKPDTPSDTTRTHLVAQTHLTQQDVQPRRAGDLDLKVVGQDRDLVHQVLDE